MEFFALSRCTNFLDIRRSKVYKESYKAKKTFDAQLIQKRINEEKIKIKKVKKPEKIEKLKKDFNISKGEAEALSLQEKTDILATDDKNAIKACKNT